MVSNLSKKYDSYYGNSNIATFKDVTSAKWPRDRVQAIVCVDGSGESILDIGCGDGSLLWQHRNRFSQLIGLEFSAKRLEDAKNNLKDLPFTGYQASAESMSMITDNSIDRIITADVIEHIPDVYMAADEMYRILKPKGLLVINTPNIAFIKKRVLLLAGRFPSTSQPNEGFGNDDLFDGGHLHYFTFRSLGLLLERSGFTLVKRMGYGWLGPVNNLHLPLTSGGVQWVAQKL